MYYAHPQNDRGEMQGLREHLEAVAEGAARFAEKFGADVARLAGLWDDLGKFHPDFQAYLLKPTASRGPNHKQPGGSLPGREGPNLW